MASLGSQALDEDPVWERMESFAGSEDSYRRPTLIDPDQCQHLLNVIIRQDYEARTRPGVDAIPTPSVAVDAGAVNGLLYFDTPSKHQLLAAVNEAVTNANIWKLEANVWTKLTGYQPGRDNRLAWAQGVDKVLLSDGSQNFYIWDGTTFTNVGGGQFDPPVGCTIVTFEAGRMFLSGLATFNDTIFVSNLLDFGTGQWDKVQRSFRVGDGDGQAIVAIAPMQNFQLAVLKSDSIWLTSVDPSVPIANYSTDQNTAVLSRGIGCVGRDAWCAYENDILFMAQDGIRSVQRMQAAAGQWKLIPPLSKPIQPYIDRINRSAWNGICAKKFQEFAFFFIPLDNSSTNNAVLVWNGVLGKWAGLWEWAGTYVEITRVPETPSNAVNQLVFGDTLGKVNQWKQDQSLTDDATYLDNGSGYSTHVWTRSFLFSDPIADKSGYSSILRFSAGDATITATWVADLASERSWNATPTPSGSILGGPDTLGDTFTLASTSPIQVIRSLRQLPEFNEAYVRVESNTGWWFLRNVSLGAFVNPLKNI